MSDLDGEVGHATYPRNPERVKLPLGEFDLQAFRAARAQRLGLPTPVCTAPLPTVAAEVDVDTAVYEQCRTDEVEMDPGAWAANRLTPQEREHFEREGYCLVENALPPAEFEAVRSLLIQMRGEMLAEGKCSPNEQAKAAAFSQANELQRESCLQSLLTTGRILPKVVDLMGTNISAYHLHLNVTPAAAQAQMHKPPEEVDYDEVARFGFHQDSGLQSDLEYRPAPRFSMKAGYFLTDVDEPGYANTWVVPAKHHLSDLDLSTGGRDPEERGMGQPPGAIPICCKANTCLLFDRRLWHTPSPNYSDRMRLACLVGYAFRWMRPKEPMYVEPAMAACRCPVKRQMLGWSSSNLGLCGPNSEDTPLVPWLKKHGIGEWAQATLRLGFRTIRDGERQAVLEGDAGHTSDSRVGQPLVGLDVAARGGRTAQVELVTIRPERRALSLSRAKM